MGSLRPMSFEAKPKSSGAQGRRSLLCAASWSRLSEAPRSSMKFSASTRSATVAVLLWRRRLPHHRRGIAHRPPLQAKGLPGPHGAERQLQAQRSRQQCQPLTRARAPAVLCVCRRQLFSPEVAQGALLRAVVGPPEDHELRAFE